MRTILFCVLAAAGCASTSKPVERPPAQQAAVRPVRASRSPAETTPSTSQTLEPETNINEGPSAPTEVPLATPNQLP